MICKLENGAIVVGYTPGMRETDTVTVIGRNGQQHVVSLGGVIAQVGNDDFISTATPEPTQ